MDRLIAKSNGALKVRREIYDKEGNVKNIIDSNIKVPILQLLSKYIILDKPFTLRDWFKMVIKYPDLQKLSSYFQLAIEEYNKAPKSGCVPEEFSTIELVKRIGMESFDTLEEEVDVYISIDGIPNNLKQTIIYGIDFCELSEILDVRIRLQNAHVYRVGNDAEILLDIKPKSLYSLYDLVTTIINELSFWKESKSKKFKKIQEEEIK